MPAVSCEPRLRLSLPVPPPWAGEGWSRGEVRRGAPTPGTILTHGRPAQPRKRPPPQPDRRGDPSLEGLAGASWERSSAVRSLSGPTSSISPACHGSFSSRSTEASISKARRTPSATAGCGLEVSVFPPLLEQRSLPESPGSPGDHRRPSPISRGTKAESRKSGGHARSSEPRDSRGVADLLAEGYGLLDCIGGYSRICVDRCAPLLTSPLSQPPPAQGRNRSAHRKGEMTARPA